MSVVYMSNSLGDSGEHWGFPADVDTLLDLWLSSFVSSVLLVMNLCIESVLPRWGRMPLLFILQISPSCHSCRRPLEISKKTAPTLCPRYSLS